MVGFLPAWREFGIFIRMRTLERFGFFVRVGHLRGDLSFPSMCRGVWVFIGFGMLGRIWDFYWNERSEDDLVFQYA